MRIDYMNQVAGNGEKAYENVTATTTLKATEYKAPPWSATQQGLLEDKEQKHMALVGRKKLLQR